MLAPFAGLALQEVAMRLASGRLELSQSIKAAAVGARYVGNNRAWKPCASGQPQTDLSSADLSSVGLSSAGLFRLINQAIKRR